MIAAPAAPAGPVGEKFTDRATPIGVDYAGH
jgi:hypothetical protein